MKRLWTIIILLVIILCLAFYTISYAYDKDTNAFLLKYIDNSVTYYLIAPKDVSEYKYLFKYPITSLGLLFMWQKYLPDLTCKQLKTFSNHGYAFNLNKVVGFEDIAAELSAADEFGIESRKKEAMSRLMNCNQNYHKEYLKYLNKNSGIYAFMLGRFNQSRHLEGYNKGVSYSEIADIWTVIRKDDYDFDNSTLRVDLLPQTSPLAAPYKMRYLQKSQVNGRRTRSGFPDYSKIKLSIEDAKKLFKGQEETYAATILEVKLTDGFYRSGDDVVQNFEIHKITKVFIRKTPEGDEKPVLFIEIKSSPKLPLF